MYRASSRPIRLPQKVLKRPWNDSVRFGMLSAVSVTAISKPIEKASIASLPPHSELDPKKAVKHIIHSIRHSHGQRATRKSIVITWPTAERIPWGHVTAGFRPSCHSTTLRRIVRACRDEPPAAWGWKEKSKQLKAGLEGKKKPTSSTAP